MLDNEFLYSFKTVLRDVLLLQSYASNYLFFLKPGTEEEFGENKQLLHEVLDLSEQVKVNKKDQEKEERETGKIIRKWLLKIKKNRY